MMGSLILLHRMLTAEQWTLREHAVRSEVMRRSTDWFALHFGSNAPCAAPTHSFLSSSLSFAKVILYA
jgi:hypothetical protein